MMLRWLAKKGAVGGTARWAAKLYKTFVIEDPDLNDDEIIALIIYYRYSVIFKRPERIRLVSIAMEQQTGLIGLVDSILIVEAGLMENSRETRKMFSDVVITELTNSGISEEVIWGDIWREKQNRIENTKAA